MRDKQGRLNLEAMPAGPKTETKVTSPERAEGEAEKSEGKLLISKAMVTGGKVWLTNLGTGQSGDIPIEECRLALELGQDKTALDLTVKMPGLGLVITPGAQPGKGHRGHLEIKADLAEFGRRLKTVMPEITTRGAVNGAFDLASDGKMMTSKGSLTVQDLLVDLGRPGQEPFGLADLKVVIDALTRVEQSCWRSSSWKVVSAGLT